MTTANKINGLWFKHSDYELTDGLIRPGLGATITEYDPWRRFRENEGRYRTVDQPYVPLLNFSRSVYTMDEEAEVHPGDNRRAELAVRWCKDHGLLGLLPSLATKIYCEGDLTHYRNGGRWQTRFLSKDFGELFEIPELRVEYGLHSSSKGSAGRGWFNWLDWETEADVQYPLDRLYSKYFPSWNSGWTPPRPNSAQFRDAYVEPLDEFVKWARLFMQAVHHLSRWGETPKPSDLRMELTARDAHAILIGMANGGLHEMSMLDITQRKLIAERVSPGLLDSFALMFLWDFEMGRRAIECETCDNYFISNEVRARYCSTTCRNTARSRRYRQRKEERTK